MVTGHSLWLHFGLDERPFATYFDVQQGYRVLTHSHMLKWQSGPGKPLKVGGPWEPFLNPS